MKVHRSGNCQRAIRPARKSRSSSDGGADAFSLRTTAASGRSSHFDRARRPRRLQHRRVRHQVVLQLDRGDPLAAGLDDVLGAVGQGQETVRGERADVAGAQPAVAELVRVRLGLADSTLR